MSPETWTIFEDMEEKRRGQIWRPHESLIMSITNMHIENIMELTVNIILFLNSTSRGTPVHSGTPVLRTGNSQPMILPPGEKALFPETEVFGNLVVIHTKGQIALYTDNNFHGRTFWSKYSTKHTPGTLITEFESSDRAEERYQLDLPLQRSL